MGLKPIPPSVSMTEGVLPLHYLDLSNRRITDKLDIGDMLVAY